MNIKCYTLGCKVNQYETEAVIEQFKSNGFTCTSELNPDVILINSCSVTAESDRKTRQLVRRERRLNPNAVIVLTGCMVEAFPEKAFELNEADLIIGNTETDKIYEKVISFLNNKNRVLSVIPHKAGEKYNTPSLSDFSERTRAYMKIEDGCNRFCTYCIIPYARGRVRSRSIDDIKSEAKRLALAGFKEIVLVGINLSAYGSDCSLNICDAVDAVCSVDGVMRVRLGSVEPDHITDKMLLRLKNQDKFCPQFHLSLQSGCDETLKRMNRHYDSAFYSDLVARIRRVFDNPSITTDIMVGFAGESDEEFKNSADFVKKIGFARSHVFVYSVRSGTAAEKFADQVPPETKEKRAAVMADVTDKCEKDFLKTQVGRVCEVLFETGENGFAAGYTKNYSRVLVKSENSHTGEILKVKITECKDNYCIGEFI